MAAKLKVTQVKSTISHIARNRAHGPGPRAARDRQHERRSTDNPATRGMVRAVRFLVTVEEIEDGANPDTAEKAKA